MTSPVTRSERHLSLSACDLAARGMARQISSMLQMQILDQMREKIHQIHLDFSGFILIYLDFDSSGSIGWSPEKDIVKIEMQSWNALASSCLSSGACFTTSWSERRNFFLKLGSPTMTNYVVLQVPNWSSLFRFYVCHGFMDFIKVL